LEGLFYFPDADQWRRGGANGYNMAWL